MLHRAAQWGGGVYENEYVKEDGVWKIAKLHYYMTYYVDYYKGWDQGGLPAARPDQGLSARPADHGRLQVCIPDVFVPPFITRIRSRANENVIWAL